MITGLHAAILTAFVAAFAAAPLVGQAVQGGPLPGPLPLLPPDNWWNVDVSVAPRDPNDASFIAWIGAAKGLHPDFGGDSSPYPQIYGMPYIVVPGSEPLEPVAFDYASESDPGAPGRPPGYPIPAEAISQPKWIEGGYRGNATIGGDKHMLIVDKDNRVLFETWNTRFNTVTQSWEAGSGAVFPLDSNQQRPGTWTSADAAGLAILPGLIFTMTGQCGVPATAKAVSGNVTAVAPSSDGAFQLFSGDDQPGVATTISFAARRTRANNVVLKLAGSGSGTLGVASTASGPVHLVIDINGFFQ